MDISRNTIKEFWKLWRDLNSSNWDHYTRERKIYTISRFRGLRDKYNLRAEKDGVYCELTKKKLTNKL